MDVYQFPKNRQDKYKARLKFQPIKIVPATAAVEGTFSKIKGFVEEKAKEAIEFAKEVKEEGLVNIDFDGKDTTRATDAEIEEVQKINTGIKIERLQEYCYLYVPVSLQFTDSVNIRNAELGLAGMAAAGALRNSNDIFGAIFQGAAQAGSSFFDFLRGNAEPELAAVAATRLAATGGDRVQAGVQTAFQIKTNPNSRSTFESVNIRNFTFTFKFVPLSRAESIEIEKIIQWFRLRMYPEHINFGAESSIPYGYRFPELFDIRVQYESSINGTTLPGRYRSLPNMEILPCYLSAVQHNYNASAMTWHSGGKPTEVDLSLTFAEYRTLSRDDIRNKSFYNLESEGEFIQ